ncbi:MAG TPA: SMR family transporter [Planktothrix sp.]|jgi:undecaprenyl phosphate-alpha-L-ara4N flippase subunit ArnE
MDARLLGLLLVLLAVTLEAGVQVSLKKTSVKGSTGKMWLTLGVICFTLNAVAWTFVLRLLDVSVAYPLGSLSFVMVAILSKFLLRENVTKKRWAGVCLILCGTAFVGLSGR